MLCAGQECVIPGFTKEYGSEYEMIRYYSRFYEECRIIPNIKNIQIQEE